MTSESRPEQRPVLIEQSAKKYKLFRGIGILILLATAIFAAANSDNFGTSEGYATVLAGIGFVVGLLVFGAGTLLTWWHHG